MRTLKNKTKPKFRMPKRIVVSARYAASIARGGLLSSGWTDLGHYVMGRVKRPKKLHDDRYPKYRRDEEA